MSKRTDTHAHILDDLTRHDHGQFCEAVARLMDARPALPGAGGGGGGRVKGSHADPTLALAMKPDPVSREIRQLDDVLRRLSADAQWLQGFMSRWLSRAPSDRDRREVERVNEGPDVLCEHCTPHLPPGSIHIERPLTANPTTVKGNLPAAMMLGRWCYDIVCDTGELPTRSMLEDRGLGKRVKRYA